MTCCSGNFKSRFVQLIVRNCHDTWDRSKVSFQSEDSLLALKISNCVQVELLYFLQQITCPISYCMNTNRDEQDMVERKRLLNVTRMDHDSSLIRQTP